MRPGFTLDAAIRRVPDFPKPGILFYDVTSILTDPEAFGYCVDTLAERYRDGHVDAITAIESRGFLFGAPLALRLDVPLLLVRKRGKLPGRTVSRTYELEYGSDTIEMHADDLSADRRHLIVDDLFATGGTARATVELIEGAGATVTEVAGVIGLPFLGFRDLLAPVPVHTLIDFDSE